MLNQNFHFYMNNKANDMDSSPSEYENNENFYPFLYIF